MLFGGGEPGVQREDLGVAEFAVAQRVRGVADLAFAGEEDQDVAVALGRLSSSTASHDRVDGIAVDELVADLHGERPVAHSTG